MKKAQLTVGTSIALLVFLCGLPLVRDDSSAGAALDIAAFICSGLHGAADSVLGGGGLDENAVDEGGGEHEHLTTPGLYMPMFSTPPKGGTVYNGPSLDDC